jgi:ribonuclease R
MPQDLYVPPPSDVGRPARPGDKVVVELGAWDNRHVNPEGEVIEVLGPPDAEGVDMLSVIRQYNLSLHFPKPVLQEARTIGSEVRETDIAGRVDCRDHLIVTIDPEDAKDFDDAIGVWRDGTNRWRLWVHIADVSHYVKSGSTLDKEAARRGNSTYLVDRVVPMLPEALSNELCSLKPDVSRLTKAVEFLLDNDGRVIESKFHSAVIRSKRRFTYKEAFAALQRRPQDEVERMLHDANNLAQKLRRSRFRSGALNLDFPESKILLDEEGRIDRIERVENDISHQLIEEFMLLANEAVARKLRSLRRPALYRIHEDPDEGRLQEFREEVLAHGIPCGNLSNRQEVRKLLERLDSTPVGAALKVSFLRSLMRARYSVEPLGHYGLAKGDYTHFTSPIRRYADLVVHRALFSRERLSPSRLQGTADHISETERTSDDAERDSRDVKLFAFLNAQLKSGEPQHYEGLVTDIRNFGFFVDVAGLGMSGLVPLSGLNDDFYILDTARGELVGRRTRRRIRMGDRLQVRVAKVDTFKRQVDFEPAPTPRTARREQRLESGRRAKEPRMRQQQGEKESAVAERPRRRRERSP